MLPASTHTHTHQLLAPKTTGMFQGLEASQFQRSVSGAHHQVTDPCAQSTHIPETATEHSLADAVGLLTSSVESMWLREHSCSFPRGQKEG